jgi:hypothetical protein
MEMAYGDQRKISELCVRLTETQESAATHIDKNSRLIADPEKIAGRRTISVDPRSNRT